MNWLLILVILFLSWNIVKGYRKGFLKSVFSMVALIIIIVMAILATPYVKEFITNNTSIEKDIQKKSHEKVSEFVKNEDAKNDESNGEILRRMGINIPDELADKLFEANTVADKLMDETGIYDFISEKITSLAVTGISFVLMLMIMGLIFLILYQLLSIIEELPVIGLFNKIAGIIVGAIRGLIFVWIFFAVIAMNSTSTICSYLISTTNTSPFLSLVYENNLILILLINFL